MFMKWTEWGEDSERLYKKDVIMGKMSKKTRDCNIFQKLHIHDSQRKQQAVEVNYITTVMSNLKLFVWGCIQGMPQYN